jgi:hypothetical protein
MSLRLGLLRLKLEDNIKMKLKKMEWVMLIVFVFAGNMEKWQALVSTVTNFRVP